MHESLVPAVEMGGMGPFNRWAGSSAVALAKQAAASNNWLITALKHAALGAVIGNGCLFGQYCSTRAYPAVGWTHSTHSNTPPCQIATLAA